MSAPGSEAAAVPPVAEVAGPAIGASTGQEAPTGHSGLDAISAGDEAWWRDDRRAAVRAWRAALAGARDGESGLDRAVEAMARVRLLQRAGSVGPFIHERALRDAQRACPEEEPWCSVARADDALFMPAFTGADPERVPGLLAGTPLVGPAAARIAVATGDVTPLRAAAEAHALDGMGRGILGTGAPRPDDPGTWTLGVGVGGAPGAGFGVNARFTHPDLAWRRHELELAGGASSLGSWSVSGALTTATRPALLVSAGAWNDVGYRWETAVQGEPSGAERWTDRGGRLSLGVGHASTGQRLRVGLSGRVDGLGEGPLLVAGPWAAWSVGTGRAWLSASTELHEGAYTHVAMSADARAYPSIGQWVVGLRGLATLVPTPESPIFRLPSAGGANLLRGEPAGRYRGEALVGAQVEVRHPIVGPLNGAVFVDTARVESWAWTAGGGLRLVLPPERTNVTRIDVGFGPGTWGVVVAWGEAF